MTAKRKSLMDATAVADMMAAQDSDASMPEPEFDPGKVDGRSLRKTYREPFATRIKPETHERLRRLAFERRITMAEVVEKAVAAYKPR